MQILHLEGDRDHMKVVWGWEHASTFQGTQAVHGSSAWPEQPGHMLTDLGLLSYDPYDLPDAENESGIVEILYLHFE